MIEIRDRRGGLAPMKLYKFEDNEDVFNLNGSKIIEDSSTTEYPVTIVQQKGNGDELSVGAGWWHHILSFVGGIFLPYGFPATVSKDYIPYQIWDTAQKMRSSLARTFSTEAVFKTLGVGDSGATVLAAAMTTLIRDGCRWSGEIFIAWVRGNAFGYNNKKWRLMADLFNDVVLTAELLSPLFSSRTVIYLLAVSSFLNGCVTIAARSAKTAVAQHQAKAGNIADVSAKENSQEKGFNLIGMGLSLIILPRVTGNLVLVRSLFGTFIGMHLFTNYLGMRALRFETLNEARLLICLKQYFRNKFIPSINRTNLSESYIMGFGPSARKVYGMDIRMGVPIKEALDFKSWNKTTKFHVPTLLEKFDGKRFLILPKKKAGHVDVVLKESISSPEIIEAYFRAAYCAYMIKKSKDIICEGVNVEWTNFRASLVGRGYNLNGCLMRLGNHKAWWSTKPVAVKVL